MSKKIFLIEPPFSMREYNKYCGSSHAFWAPPLWAISLGTFLRESIPGIYIKILDGQLIHFGQMRDQILKVRPDVVGISPNFNTYTKALRLARIVKKTGAKVVFGGAHATGLAREIIENRGPASSLDYCVDAVVKGDGEKAFYDFVAGMPLDKIKNLVYQENGQIRENQIEFMNLDTLPMLDFGLVSLDDYFEDNQKRFPQFKRMRMLRMYSQKGCFWRKINRRGCIFCCFPGGGMRIRKPNIVWREITNLVQNYGINLIHINSDLAFEDRHWLEKFYKEAKKMKYSLPSFATSFRIGNGDDLSARKMREININFVCLGVESGCKKTLQTLNTGTTPELIRKNVKLLSKHGFRMTLYFTLGAPGETRQTLKTTIKFAKELSGIKGVELLLVSAFTPLPGSSAWDLFLSKTGNKYARKDAINFRLVWIDWVKHFCNVSHKEIISAKNIIKGLN